MCYAHSYVRMYNDALNVGRIERRVKNRIPVIYNILYTTNGTSDPVIYRLYIIGKRDKFSNGDI